MELMVHSSDATRLTVKGQGAGMASMRPARLLHPLIVAGSYSTAEIFCPVPKAP